MISDYCYTHEHLFCVIKECECKCHTQKVIGPGELIALPGLVIITPFLSLNTKEVKALRRLLKAEYISYEDLEIRAVVDKIFSVKIDELDTGTS